MTSKNLIQRHQVIKLTKLTEILNDTVIANLQSGGASANGLQTWQPKVAGYDNLSKSLLDDGNVVTSIIDGNQLNPNIDSSTWRTDKVVYANRQPTTKDENTRYLQGLINKAKDGVIIDLLGKTFVVRKSTEFADYFTLNDQPCLVVMGKENITITNGVLKVEEHGQGILEFVNCDNWAMDAVDLIGFGNNFPKLDGITGRGEKSGTATEGYYYLRTDGSAPRNNSVDTSTMTTGFGGTFPQYGGGTDKNWGVWGGGFIANYGYGVTCTGGSGLVTNSKIQGFNGSGVFGRNYKSLVVYNNEITNCYVAGVESFGFNSIKTQPELYLVVANRINNIGHPDAKITDTNMDPGYGVTTGNSNNGFGRPKFYIAERNTVTNCKRKGIDAHSSDYISVNQNVIRNSGMGIASVTNMGTNPTEVKITNNTIENIEYCVSDAALGIVVRGNSRTLGSTTITGNFVKNVGRNTTRLLDAASGRGIYVGTILSALISNNTVYNDDTFVGSLGIGSAINSSQYTQDVMIANNKVKGCFNFGIFVFGVESTTTLGSARLLSKVVNNSVHLYDVTQYKPTWAVSCYTLMKNTQVSGNSGFLDSTVKSQYYLDSGRDPVTGVSVAFTLTKTSGVFVVSDLFNTGDNLNISDIATTTVAEVTGQGKSIKITIPRYFMRPLNGDVINYSPASVKVMYSKINTANTTNRDIFVSLFNGDATPTRIDADSLAEGFSFRVRLDF